MEIFLLIYKQILSIEISFILYGVIFIKLITNILRHNTCYIQNIQNEFIRIKNMISIAMKMNT